MARLYLAESLVVFPAIITLCEYTSRLRTLFPENVTMSLDNQILENINAPSMGFWSNVMERICLEAQEHNLGAFIQELAANMKPPQTLAASIRKLSALRNAQVHPPHISQNKEKNKAIVDGLDLAIDAVLEFYTIFYDYRLLGRTSLPHSGLWLLQGNNVVPFKSDLNMNDSQVDSDSSVFLFSNHRKELLSLSPFLETIIKADQVTGHHQIELAIYKKSVGASLLYYFCRTPEETLSLEKTLPMVRVRLRAAWEIPKSPWPSDEILELSLVLQNQSFYPISNIKISTPIVSKNASGHWETEPPLNLLPRETTVLQFRLSAMPGIVDLEETEISYQFLERQIKTTVSPNRLICHEPKPARFEFCVSDSPRRLSTGERGTVPITINNLGNKRGETTGEVRATFIDMAGELVFEHGQSFSVDIAGESSATIEFNFTPEIAGPWYLSISWEPPTEKGLFNQSLLTPLIVHWTLAPVETIGRDTELGKLQSLLNEQKTRESCLIEIKGEAGTGKSRILNDIAEIAALSGCFVLRGTCEQTLQTVPFSAIRSCLTRKEYSAGDLRLIGGLQKLLGNLEERTVEEKDIRLGQVRATELLARHINRQLVITLDDGQWIDTASAEFVTYLLRHASSGVPIKVFVSYRVEDVLPATSKRMTPSRIFPQASRTYSIEIQPFNKKSTGILISTMLGQLQYPDELLDAVYRETEGNPLFIVHLIDGLRSKGSLLLRNARWFLNAPVGELQLPASLGAILRSRTKELDETQFNLIEDASVIGRSFPLRLLESICSCSSDVLSAAINAFEYYKLAKVEHERFSFTHGKIKDEIYKHITPLRRIRLHSTVADLIQELYPDRKNELAALVAYHLTNGEREEDAVYWLYIAATNQAAMRSEAEIRSQFNAILNTLKRFKDPLAVSARRTVQLKLARFLEPTQSSHDAESIFQSILADVEGDASRDDTFEEETTSPQHQQEPQIPHEFPADNRPPAREAPWLPEASFSKQQLIGRSHLGLGMLAQARNDSKTAKKEFEAALEALDSEDSALGEAYLGLAWVEHDKANLKSSLKLFDKANEIFVKRDRTKLQAEAHIDQGRILLLLGRLAEAEHMVREGLKISKELNDFHALAYAYNNLGEVFRLAEKWELAERAYNQSIKYFTRCHHQPRTIFPISNQAKLLCQLGRFQEAEEKALESFSLSEKHKNRHTAGVCLTTLAQLHWIRNSVATMNLVDQALEKVKRLKHPANRGRLLQARIWLSNGENDRAEKAAKRILREFKREGDLFYQLMTELLLCQITLNDGVITRLRDANQNPYRWIRVRAHLLEARRSKSLNNVLAYEQAMQEMVFEVQQTHDYLFDLAQRVIAEGPEKRSSELIMRTT